jgi:phosphatidylinositol glycan class A protein
MGAIQYKLGMAVYGTVLALVGFIATLEAIVLALIGKRFNVDFYVARTFYYLCSPIIGWYIDMEGEEHLLNLQATGPAVILGNHQSMVDILYLGRMFPKRAAIMAKKELKWLPGLGTFMMLSGSVFLDRKNNKSAVAMMNAAGDEMKRKKISVFVFPEGTRHLSDEPFLLPFKKGAFHMAVRAGVPIVPVVCESYSKLLKPGKYFRRGTLKLRGKFAARSGAVALAPFPQTN